MDEARDVLPYIFALVHAYARIKIRRLEARKCAFPKNDCLRKFGKQPALTPIFITLEESTPQFLQWVCADLSSTALTQLCTNSLGVGASPDCCY